MVNKRSYPVRKSLPTTYYTHIGRLTFKWAYLEWRVRRTLYALMRVSPKHGRIAVRDPNINDYLVMVEDLLYLEGIRTTVDMGKLREALKKVESYRNKVSHGVWVERSDSDVPVLQDTRGAHPQEFDSDKRARNARINPKALAITIDNFKNWYAIIDSAVDALTHLGEEIDAQRKPSPDRPQTPPPDTSAANPQIQNQEEPDTPH